MEVSIKKGLFASVTYLILKIISWLWVNGVSIFLWQATKKLVTRIHRLASFSLLAYYLICSFLARGPVTHSLRANFSCSLAICFVSQLRTRTECCASWIGRRGGVVWGGGFSDPSSWSNSCRTGNRAVAEIFICPYAFSPSLLVRFPLLDRLKFKTELLICPLEQRRTYEEEASFVRADGQKIRLKPSSSGHEGKGREG